MELLKGYRVLDVSSHGAVPIAGSILADWGADVIKVEDPEHRDIIRGGTIWGVPPPGAAPATCTTSSTTASGPRRSTSSTSAGARRC